jgi:hypothetical protein
MSDETIRRRGYIRGQYYSPADKRARKIAFLAAIVEGLSIAEAAARVTVPWRTVYSWRKDDDNFRKAWNEARKRAGEAQFTYPLPPLPKPVAPKPVVTVRNFDLPEDDNG